MNTVSRSPHRDLLLAAIDTHADFLRAGANGCEDRRSLQPESIRVLHDAGLLAALVPEEVGGFQVDPITEMELIEAVSAIDGSTGWSYWALAGSTARVASMLPEKAAGDVFQPQDRFPLFAFQESPFGNVVRPHRDGLLVTGRWPFATGVEHAEWVVAIGARDPRSEPGSWPDSPMLAAAVPVSEITVVDYWDPAGLAGTGTVEYQIDEVLVPWNRVWAYPVEAPVRGGAHFCFRRAPIKHTGFALGVARHAITGLGRHLRDRATRSDKPLAPIRSDFARSVLTLDAARALAVETISTVWREALVAGGVSAASQARLRGMARYVTEVAIDVCGLVARYGDASMLARQHPLHRALRDITAGAVHAEVGHLALDELGDHLLSDRDGSVHVAGAPDGVVPVVDRVTARSA